MRSLGKNGNAAPAHRRLDQTHLRPERRYVEYEYPPYQSRNRRIGAGHFNIRRGTDSSPLCAACAKLGDDPAGPNRRQIVRVRAVASGESHRADDRHIPWERSLYCPSRPSLNLCESRLAGHIGFRGCRPVVCSRPMLNGRKSDESIVIDFQSNNVQTGRYVRGSPRTSRGI